ncbi:hypothetical protein NKH52_02495 [Mesorhizobium sp. M1066]|uniref:Uncharacterized protein n=1 Tax=Mesorhizobium opportunistum TaxID=593909 RepID=A0ABV1YKK6_9HYPH|nr:MULTISPECIES: hypothetical protein [unclassified Mesorhizobium]ESY03825.1 hypothetical protein X753_19905 [Mesorhizobium sp. LNJC399B00]WJI67256.1 hypothetical protein NLY36_20410 [Mesorhizobium sp. C399B]
MRTTERDRPPSGWFVVDVMRREARKWDWTALMTDTHPDDDLEARIFAKQCWVRIPGKHRNRDEAWDMFEAMSATRH